MSQIKKVIDQNKLPSEDFLRPFKLFGVSPTFNLDPTWLDDSFLQKQIALHPDQFIKKPQEQKKAEKAFADIVQAYEVLKDPKLRAKMLFQQKGLWPVPHDPDILEELLEIEEDFARGTLSYLEIEEKEATAFEALAHAFEDNDWHAAGTAFMVWNALLRMQKSRENPPPMQ